MGEARRGKVRTNDVRDSNGQQLAYVYFEDEPGARSTRRR